MGLLDKARKKLEELEKEPIVKEDAQLGIPETSEAFAPSQDASEASIAPAEEIEQPEDIVSSEEPSGITEATDDAHAPQPVAEWLQRSEKNMDDILMREMLAAQQEQPLEPVIEENDTPAAPVQEEDDPPIQEGAVPPIQEGEVPPTREDYAQPTPEEYAPAIQEEIAPIEPPQPDQAPPPEPTWMPLPPPERKKAEKKMRKNKKALDKAYKKGELTYETWMRDVDQLEVKHGLVPPPSPPRFMPDVMDSPAVQEDAVAEPITLPEPAQPPLDVQAQPEIQNDIVPVEDTETVAEHVEVPEPVEGILYEPEPDIEPASCPSCLAERELERLRNKLGNLHMGQPGAHQEREELEARMQEIRAERQNLEVLEKRIEEMEGSNRERMEWHKAEVGKLESEIDSMFKTHGQELSQRQAEYAELQTREKELVARERDLESLIKTLNDKTSTQEMSEKQLREEVRALEEERKRLAETERQGKEEASRSEAEFEEQMKVLREQLERTGAEINGLSEETAKFKAQEERLKRMFKVLDDLLEHLPEDVVQKFAESEDYKLYDKLMDELDI